MPVMREILPVLDWLVQVHACFHRQCRGDDKEDLEEVKALKVKKNSLTHRRRWLIEMLAGTMAISVSLACIWSTTTPFLFDMVLEMNIPV